MKAIIQLSTYRDKSELHYDAQPVYNCRTITDCLVKIKELPHHVGGLSFTGAGYGSRIPTRYMVFHGGKWRRVYSRIYSNAGTLYIGRLKPTGERATVDIEGA